MLMYNIIAVLSLLGKLPSQGWGELLPLAVVYIAIITLLPRFIMNIRELYARNLRCSSYESEIDAGFGMSKESGWATSMTAIAFADSEVEKDEGFEDEDIQMEERKFENGDVDA
ncbi:hypothetical protein JVU11DRAFT_8130 [Chiua virens]|nr:hypothetical protein JVU11DRAFT_8130 [Chiua virens]